MIGSQCEAYPYSFVLFMHLSSHFCFANGSVISITSHLIERVFWRSDVTNLVFKYKCPKFQEELAAKAMTFWSTLLLGYSKLWNESGALNTVVTISWAMSTPFNPNKVNLALEYHLSMLLYFVVLDSLSPHQVCFTPTDLGEVSPISSV